MPRLLLVEDDPGIATSVADYLRREGFVVEVATDGPAGLRAVRDAAPDLLLLDWMLPGFDGVELCRRVRPDFGGPILMLTARTDDVDQIVALEVGVDDFVAKPVRPRVLLARVRALLRRAAPAPSGDRLEVGVLVVDRSRREVTVEGRPVPLTTAEFDLLWVLAEHAGQPLERDALFLALRGIPYDGVDRSIDMRVATVRRKLRDALPRWVDPILTVRGVGYQLAKP